MTEVEFESATFGFGGWAGGALTGYDVEVRL